MAQNFRCCCQWMYFEHVTRGSARRGAARRSVAVEMLSTTAQLNGKSKFRKKWMTLNSLKWWPLIVHTRHVISCNVSVVHHSWPLAAVPRGSVCTGKGQSLPSMISLLIAKDAIVDIRHRSPLSVQCWTVISQFECTLRGLQSILPSDELLRACIAYILYLLYMCHVLNGRFNWRTAGGKTTSE